MLMPDSEMVSVLLQGEDLEILRALVAKEKLTRSDVLRRAIRAYADQLRVRLPKKRSK
jgi:Arc/MetJ-type ribon-helix-helix transcriptional regulator